MTDLSILVVTYGSGWRNQSKFQNVQKVFLRQSRSEDARNIAEVTPSI